jgi:hypothetical protein
MTVLYARLPDHLRTESPTHPWPNPEAVRALQAQRVAGAVPDLEQEPPAAPENMKKRAAEGRAKE